MAGAFFIFTSLLASFQKRVHFQMPPASNDSLGLFSFLHERERNLSQRERKPDRECIVIGHKNLMEVIYFLILSDFIIQMFLANNFPLDSKLIIIIVDLKN